MKFKIGDRVKAVRINDGNEKILNKIGTVVCVKLGYNGIAVNFDDNVNGHGFETSNFDHSMVKPKHGWWCNDNDLVKVENNSFEKIVITTNGKITNATLYNGDKRVKSAIARCNSEDEFNFERGALIAFSRLIGCDYRLAEESLDWDEFKNDKIFVQVTEENFDDFIKEAERYGCFFKNHDKFNPFKNFNAKLLMCLMRNVDDELSVSENTIFITYEDNSLKVSPINIDNRTVFVW